MRELAWLSHIIGRLSLQPMIRKRDGLVYSGGDNYRNVGFFLFAIHFDHIDLAIANTLLHKMIAAGYHSPVEDLGKI